MNGLNYHHLRYFWLVAREGGLRRAAEKLHVSPPLISAQIRELEDALDEKLFRRSGRGNVLTDAGQVALRYAAEIFCLGRELSDALKQAPSAKALRLPVGVADAFPTACSLSFYLLRQTIACHHRAEPELCAAHRRMGRKDLVALF